jgi:hypothetical protein
MEFFPCDLCDLLRQFILSCDKPRGVLVFKFPCSADSPGLRFSRLSYCQKNGVINIFLTPSFWLLSGLSHPPWAISYLLWLRPAALGDPWFNSFGCGWPRRVLAFNCHAPRTTRTFDFQGFLSEKWSQKNLSDSIFLTALSACIPVICGQFRIRLRPAALALPAAKAGPPKILQKGS